LQQTAFLVELLKLLKEQNIHTTIDTCGFAPNVAFHQVAPLADLFLFDVKHMETVEHQLLTGVRNDMVLHNLRYLVKEGKRVIVRFPLIPGLNDGEQNLKAMEELFAELPGLSELHILPYHSIAKGKYQRLGIENLMDGIAEPTSDAVAKVASRFTGIGLVVKIGG